VTVHNKAAGMATPGRYAEKGGLSCAGMPWIGARKAVFCGLKSRGLRGC